MTEELWIDVAEFKQLFIDWCKAGKPEGNSAIYMKIWDGVINAVKADIGRMQKLNNVEISHYDDKVIDSAAKVITKLRSLPESDAPKSIITLAWLYTYGVCFGPNAIQEDYEDKAESLNAIASGGDECIDVISESDIIQHY